MDKKQTSDLGQLFEFTSVTLTAAQVNALNGTPLTVVPAPGPAWIVILDEVQMQYVYGSAAFTIGSASGLAFNYTNGAGLQLAQCAVTGFLDQASNQRRSALAYRAASAASQITPVANAPIVAQMLTANVSVGTGCSLKLRAFYRRVPANL